ncbi:helix-turn-helix transcriptional regulator [Thalassobacillus sp. CUG 92003]|uniref:ArsR/SmtB family transcription factor n=1 Tax=Thalassobacillus sp. CUG 92003 TaxID=2736641 RepID=UPI0015E78594|nr:metalloregulator ArsR/SmtB family transcription factor [Thalassobacillus sp. CUG 92003]
MFKALSNAYRLEIFLYLADYCRPGEMSTEEEMRVSVGELGSGLGIAPSTVSHHLKELRHAHLIRMERNGKNIECWVEPDTLDQLITFFKHAKEGN